MSTPTSIRVTHRTNRTVPTFLLQTLLRTFKNYLFTPPNPSFDSTKLSIPDLTNCDIREREIHGLFVYDISLQNDPNIKCRRRIYYIAGGSWRMPPGKPHWLTAARFVQELRDTQVTIISVPLAQNTPAPQAWPQLLEVYRELMNLSAQAEEAVVWAGDSSGGNLILSLTIHMLKNDPTITAPSALLAISPSVDLTRNNPDIQIVEKNDPVLSFSGIRQSAAVWAGDWDKKDPRLSPLFGDLTVLKERGVKVHGVTAGYDILGPDGLLFRQKCQDIGIQGEWLEWDKQMHDFPLLWMYHLGEAQEGIAWILDVLSKS